MRGAWVLVASLLTGAFAPILAQDEVDRAIAAAVSRAAKARDAGRVEDMKREVEAAARIAGDAPRRRQGLAAQLLDQGFPDIAAQVCAQNLSLDPGDALSRGILGIARCRTNRCAEAIQDLKTATEKEPLRARWWLELGRAHLAANQEAAALAAIERALTLAPDDVVTLELRAECEYRNMRMPECEATCRKVLAKDPKSPTAWQLLIRARRTQGRLDEALQSADDAIKAIGRNPDIVLERGLVLLATNKNEEAAADLREAASRMPSDPRPHLHLCKVYARLGLTKEAGAAKARYLELSPDLKKPETGKSK